MNYYQVFYIYRENEEFKTAMVPYSHHKEHNSNALKSELWNIHRGANVLIQITVNKIDKGCFDELVRMVM